MYNLIAFYGESGSGKDALAADLIKKYPDIFEKIISYSSRPKRDYESNGNPYWFIATDDFKKMIDNGEMLEYTVFNEDWYYGTAIDSLKQDKINIGIFNPEGIEFLYNLNEEENFNIIFVRVKCLNDTTRIFRTLTRESNPNCYEICRRFVTDTEDFNRISYIKEDVLIDTTEMRTSEDFIKKNEIIEILAALAMANKN